MGYNMRIGIGYDAHRLVEDRELIIGGVKIPHSKGLLGHSDADVLLHAVCDALLGAAGLGDIGKHFPDKDPKYKGISSMLLLEHTVSLLKTEGYKVVNIDCTVIAQAPKIAPYIDEIKHNREVAKIFEPEMDIEKRDALYADWKRAVKCSMGWAK